LPYQGPTCFYTRQPNPRIDHDEGGLKPCGIGCPNSGRSEIGVMDARTRRRGNGGEFQIWFLLCYGSEEPGFPFSCLRLLKSSAYLTSLLVSILHSVHVPFAPHDEQQKAECEPNRSTGTLGPSLVERAVGNQVENHQC